MLPLKYDHIMYLQQELRDEVKERWSEIMDDPTTTLPKMESMMKEILRLYPIAPFISRQNNVPVNLGNIHLDQHVSMLHHYQFLNKYIHFL
jgi:cytochrome P450